MANIIGSFSDVHIGLGQDSPIWHNITLDFAKWAAEKFLHEGINDIIIPGDIFHNRSEIGVNTLATAAEFFKIFKDFRLYISVGNHDIYYKDRTDVNSISLFDGWDNITIIDSKPSVINYGNKKVSLIPWATDIADIPESDICFGHFEINTFYMNTYKVCEHGVDSKNILNKSPLVFSGHFHKKDHRKYDSGQIVYLGSPFQHNFGDVGDKRGIYTINVDKGTFKFIENTISPKHIKVYLSKINSKKHDDEFFEKNIPKNIISLVVDEEIKSDALAIIVANIYKHTPISIRVDYKSVSEDFSGNPTNTDYNMIDIEKNIEDFVESIDIPHKKETIDYLTAKYKELIA